MLTKESKCADYVATKKGNFPVVSYFDCFFVADPFDDSNTNLVNLWEIRLEYTDIF